MMKPETVSYLPRIWRGWRSRRGLNSINTPVDQLLCDGEQIYGVKCGDEVIKAGSAYVMAFGSYSTAMLKGIVDIPVYPLKGYSLTIPIAQMVRGIHHS